MKLTLIQGHLLNDLALGSGQLENDLIQKTWLHSIHRDVKIKQKIGLRLPPLDYLDLFQTF